MNEFQASLLLIGVAVVLGVLAYNKWQERRATRAADEVFRSRHPDVLIGEGDAQAGEHPVAQIQTRIESVPVSQLPIAADSPIGDGGDAGRREARVDYIVGLTAEHPIAVSAALDHWARIEHRFARRATLSGWIDGKWTTLARGAVCERLQAALQLVSRKGVLSESELLEFRSEVETLASKLGASAVCAEMREALEAARGLDTLCVEADIQIVLQVVAPPGAVLSGTKLRAAVEASGFILDNLGRFVLHDESGRELYSLSDRAGGPFAAATMKDTSPRAVTLALDVPRTPDTQRTFAAMVRFGRHLSGILGGALVDDNNRPLDDRAMVTIDAQLTVVRQSLETHGISPGSALAMRLFS